MKEDSYKVKEKIELKNFASEEVIKKADKKLKKISKKLAKLQNAMYAEGKYSVLLCLQGMDTSGKDSLIREVFKNFNARGIEVQSFKVPTELELKHDFLWRHYIVLPAKGKVGIFNRSHYENLLVTRVHPSYILEENIPSIKSVDDVTDAFFENRMERINNFESHLVDNGTLVLKFYLNLSKEEQKNRLLRRLNIPEKNWKFSEDDLKERKLWDKYMFCYEDLLNKTATEKAPWFIIPADDKDTCRYIFASILLDQLEKYNFEEPTLDGETLAKVGEFKAQLSNE